ncbi:MAG: hypothetical protein LBV68_00145 [Spirochaetaceae bacterium]|jgi:hypothetical protein|nr:hypothetical protein [Spirochaetaceae bacterium]
MKEKIIYARGELDQTKGRIGPIGEQEAKRMQKILGGEVGRERTQYEETQEGKGKGSPQNAVTGKAKRTVELASDGSEAAKKPRMSYPSNVPQPGYIERVKMDICCGDVEFGIKTPWRVFISKLSIFKAPRDLVSPYFIKEIIDEYYKQIEILVTSVRLLFPRNNSSRNLKLQKYSSFSFHVLDVLRQWKIASISDEIAKLQQHPRNVYVYEFATILREIYKPLAMLENVSVDTHVRIAFDKLYKILFLENPNSETEKTRPKISNALSALSYTQTHIHRFLYPLLMKMTSSVYYSYDLFFSANKENIMAFLGLKESDKITVPSSLSGHKDITEEDTAEEDRAEDDVNGEKQGEENFIEETEDGENPENSEKKVESEKRASEEKAIAKGMDTLELLFPQAGWNKLDEADFYPYFADILGLKKGSEVISPCDPAQFALILSRIISELLYGFRSVQFSFGFNEEDYITPILDHWQKTLEETFYNNYMPRIEEYAHMFEAMDSAKSNYALNLLNDIHWSRRYYLFPHYEYKSGMLPSFSKKGIHSLFSISRRLRQILTELAEDINAAMKNGGMETGALCLKLKNPWAPYVFEIENPLSKRLNVLLSKKQRTNISLIFFTLAICTVLDDHLNNPSSRAYSCDKDIIFRSVNNNGKEPVLWMEKRSDVNELFKKSVEERKAKT